jgi:hypothetical protein
MWKLSGVEKGLCPNFRALPPLGVFPQPEVFTHFLCPLVAVKVGTDSEERTEEMCERGRKRIAGIREKMLQLCLAQFTLKS